MTPLDSRSWLVWGVSCMVPLLISRHPLLVMELLIIVLTVRYVALPESSMRWRWVIRVAAAFAAIGVVFNALTVRTGNQVAFVIPGLEWDITWNAIAYGFVSGFAMIALVLTGITTTAGLDWIALTRVLPGRLAPLAVSGSVAWSFLPGASQALTDIREAQAARGHELRSGRDILPIVVPLLDGSLGRALTMSETLEARGFGASAEEQKPAAPLSAVWNGMCVLGILLLAFGISMGDQRVLWPALAIAVIGAIGIMRTPQATARTTSYHEHRLKQRDYVVIVASLIGVVAFLTIAATDFAGITFNPYPNLELPPVDYRLLLALTLLMAPALFPASEHRP